ncbi:hypothetical protein HPB47_018657 [Ixodes persulcatus]|uniref:Uncharacterized protein n=1 Tax=Ixodes persulcatus TaxID=34615 RepID=A0AC60QL13_IXOPE|nr:hypothetical protein HPB47_018657 [Ixodes persulcatus]
MSLGMKAWMPSKWNFGELQAQASSAGSYFFKCCICNNIDAFQKEMLDHGICIPVQDASWERELGAYQDLLYRYQRCDAERCRCPSGREASLEESGDWEVITCSTCGSQGIHRACGNLSKEPLQHTNSWVCVQCRKTLSLTPGIAMGQSSQNGSVILARPQPRAASTVWRQLMTLRPTACPVPSASSSSTLVSHSN